MKTGNLFHKLHRDGLTAGVIILGGEKHSYIPPSRKRSPWPPRLIIIGVTVTAGLILFFLAQYLYRTLAIVPVTDIAPSATAASLPLAEAATVLSLILDAAKAAELETYLSDHSYRDSADDYGWTALHWAMLTKNSRAAYLLIQKGADPDARSTREWYIFAKGTSPRDIARAFNFFI